ncbi:MAG: peptidylprolyl isomerase [Bdellovibrio sp.]|jgi:peptidyl-prolyl cis-trans isomerase C
MTNPPKIKLSHILVLQKYEAEDLLRKLQERVPFEELAQKYSKCPSSKQGGSLGLVALSRLDDDFVDAAKALKPGEVSPIIRTKFGYHLIRRDGL